MKRLTLPFSIIFILLIVSSVLQAQPWSSRLDSVMTIIEKEEIFHGQLLIAENNNVLFSKAYGNLEDKAVNQKITNSTPLKIESVTKAFTSLSILLLEHRGLLKLNDPLIKFLPELPYNEVTIKHLLNMTSGLPRFLETAIKYADTTEVIRNPEIIKLISKYKPTAEKSGNKFRYNNSNYLLLASIIERVSNTSYATFIQENIFNPLKMNNSYISSSNNIDAPISTNNFYQPYGEGNGTSTAKDLHLFVRSLNSDQIVPTNKFVESLNNTVLANGQKSNYGFAWRTSLNDKGTEAYIIGEGANTRASIQWYLEEDKIFIYLHNYSGAYQEQVYQTVKNIWEGNDYQMPGKRVIYNIDQTLYKKYAGKYLSETFGLLHVTHEGNKLFLRPDPIPGKEQLIPSSETTFYFGNQSLEWEFFLDEKENVIGLNIKGQKEGMAVKQD